MRIFLLKVICVFSMRNIVLGIQQGIELSLRDVLNIFLRKSWSRIGQCIESKLPFLSYFPQQYHRYKTEYLIIFLRETQTGSTEC